MDETAPTTEIVSETRFPYPSPEALKAVKESMAKTPDGWAVIDVAQFADGSGTIVKAHIREDDMAQLTVIKREYGHLNFPDGDYNVEERIEVTPDGRSARFTQSVHEPATPESPFSGFATHHYIEVVPGHVSISGWEQGPVGQRAMTNALREIVNQPVGQIDTWAQSQSPVTSNQ